jgi:DNA processing protein
MQFVVPGDARYPTPLFDLAHPPEHLWGIGDWSMTTEPVVAIVGTRRATPYGERITRELATALARAGACVVSGMALGIDGVAHRATLDVGGRTIAVLGTGVDIAYPRAHRRLYSEIAERGLVLSELPPGSHCHRGSFPNRNRIIAALARVTIVTEAPFGSGALHTTDHADTIGRTVGAVPGPIDSPASAGTNNLIRDGGATVIACVEDAMTLMGLSMPAPSSPAIQTDAERRVWNGLQHGPATLDGLCALSGLPVQECLAAVTALELRGSIECALTGEIRKR